MHPGSRSESDADRGRRGVRSRAGRARRGYSVCDEAHSQRGRSCCSPYSGVRDTSCSRLLVGTAVKAHPLGAVLAVATRFLLGGIPGALFAVPTGAALNVIIVYVVGGSWKDNVSLRVAPRFALWRTESTNSVLGKSGFIS